MKQLPVALVCLCLYFCTLPVCAQDDQTIIPAGFRSLSFGSQVPGDLLHTKSVVFISMASQARKDAWKELAAEAHNALRKAGVDAVAYYYLDDATAGRDVARRLAEDFKKRGIQQIVIVSQQAKRTALVITQFNGEGSFATKAQPAYKQEAPGSEQLFIEFGKAVARANIPVENLLINDYPEFFMGTGNVIKGKRYEAFAQDLKLDKLAVPRLQEADVLLMPGTQAATVEARITEENQRLESALDEYPYTYGLVDADTPEDKLRQQGGYQYILLKLHTSESHIRDMLGYKDTENGSENGSFQNKAVYKYYIKHIYTGDIYLGNHWDASDDWRTALTNYIQHMKAGLNIGK